MADLTIATVLNVNDDEASRYLATRILLGEGWRVVEAATGEEALRLALLERPDVAVLDVQLPDISGYEVCQRLRARPETASISVLHTSATYLTPEKKVRGLEGGADAYLPEPFEAEELIATVRSLLRMRRAEQELRRRTEVLTENDRRKDEFLAMLAHELRNPLAAITTAVGLLQRRERPDPRDARMLGIIQRQSNHLARLVEDLLDVSRLTRGQLDLRRARVDLRGVVEQGVSAFRPRAEGRQLALSAHLDASPLWLEADPTRLEQIFTNLLDNAGKYTDPGGAISVSVEEVPGPGSTREARVQVLDTGIGIAPDVLPRVFELFTQADNSLEHTRGGLGIGLTLVRNLVALHGGRVEAYSDGLGHGSRFTLWLPLLPEARAEAGAVVVPEMVKRRRHVLLLEPPEDASPLRALLESWGHRVETVSEGSRGVELAEVLAPELALVDLGLPGLDGSQVAGQMRARFGRGVRMVALTPQEGAEGERQAREAGFDTHLAKPVRPDALNRLLSEL